MAVSTTSPPSPLLPPPFQLVLGIVAIAHMLGCAYISIAYVDGFTPDDHEARKHEDCIACLRLTFRAASVGRHPALLSHLI